MSQFYLPGGQWCLEGAAAAPQGGDSMMGKGIAALALFTVMLGLATSWADEQASLCFEELCWAKSYDQFGLLN